MEKNGQKSEPEWFDEILKDKEKIFEAIRNSPGLKRRNEEAAAELAKLQRPFPWEKVKTESNS